MLPVLHLHSGGGIVVVKVVVVVVCVAVVVDAVVVVVTVVVVAVLVVVVSMLHSVSKCDGDAWLVPNGHAIQRRREICVSTYIVFMPHGGCSAQYASASAPFL